ncbi:MAG: CDC27 family protein [Candidatus Obscuribacterales bacterium]|nr:CDC27 family protein [Candidatus Obscuribacterales bacterium]
MHKRLSLLISIAVGLHTALPCYGQEHADLNKAQQFYLSDKSGQALMILNTILESKTKALEARYLKAHCLVKLNRLAEASHEYALVAHLAGSESQLGKSASAAQHGIEVRQLHAAKAKECPTRKSTKIPPGTLELIRYQVTKAKERALEAGQRDADDDVKKADNQARSEHERVERLANEQGRNSAVVHQQLEVLRQRAAVNAENLKQLGAAKAAMKEQESKEKADNLERQAEELEDQLVNDRQSRNGGMRLNPVGTNLYTRNYVKVPPAVKPLRAQTQCLPDPEAFKSVSTMLNSRNRQPSGASSGKTVTKVKGTVVSN